MVEQKNGGKLEEKKKKERPSYFHDFSVSFLIKHVSPSTTERKTDSSRKYRHLVEAKSFD